MQAAVAAAEAAALEAEAAHAAARQELEATRNPLAEAERRVQRLETEAKTLSKVLAVETKNLWPPVMDAIAVDKGFEKALGAALGDDLDAPVDPSAPMRWMGSAIDPSDPALPEGVEPLAKHVLAPDELARRLSQIGVVDRAEAPRFLALLKPGQRLVSPKATCGAGTVSPPPRMRRPAPRGDWPSAPASPKSRPNCRAPASSSTAARGKKEAAEAALRNAGAAETEARAAARERQREANGARDRYEAGERERNRHAARLSALTEAHARLTASRDEAAGAKAEAERALGELAPATDLEAELAQVRDDIAGKRAQLAEIRAEQQAIVREAELADRRLKALAADKAASLQRQEGARAQLVTLEQRLTEAQSARAELENAPQAFAEKRDALISEVQLAEADRRACADRLAEAENALAEADRDARAALEAASTRARGTGARRGTLRGRQAAAYRHRARNPRHAGDRAGQCRRAGRNKAG